LQAFETGVTNGIIQELEHDLEGDVRILAVAVKNLPPGEESTDCIRLLRRFSDYRAAHTSRRNDSLLSEEEFAYILSLISTNSR
jgi:hypothetical protein